MISPFVYWSNSHSFEFSIMYFSRSLLASAIILLFSTTAQSRVANTQAGSLEIYDSKDRKLGFADILDLRSLRNFFRKRQGQDAIDCTPNLGWNILQAAAKQDSQEFCNIWLGIPPTTTEIDYTPTM